MGLQVEGNSDGLVIGSLRLLVDAHVAYALLETAAREDEIAMQLVAAGIRLLVDAERRWMGRSRMHDVPSVVERRRAVVEGRQHPWVLRRVRFEIEVAGDDGPPRPDEGLVRTAVVHRHPAIASVCVAFGVNRTQRLDLRHALQR